MQQTEVIQAPIDCVDIDSVTGLSQIAIKHDLGCTASHFSHIHHMGKRANKTTHEYQKRFRKTAANQPAGATEPKQSTVSSLSEIPGNGAAAATRSNWLVFVFDVPPGRTCLVAGNPTSLRDLRKTT